jgi:teichuronic acid biosynthesis glycosyltransferase TuaC
LNELKPIRLLGVIPGIDEATGMWFARRQMATVIAHGVVARSFFLRSRTSPLKVSRELQRLRREIREFRPDVIHAHFGTMTAFIAAVATRIPLVITFHGSDLNPAPGMPWLRSVFGRTLSHLALRRAAQVVCVSGQLRGRIGYRRHRVHVVPCGVDFEQFRPMSRELCRTKLGWSRNEKVVLFNARNDSVGKRLDLAEAASNYAKERIPNLRLHVFRGTTHPKDMPLYYGAADSLLMTSDYEGSPMVIKEALACNLPVVSVDVGDVSERLAGVNPSTIVDRDAASIGEALVKIIAMNCRSNGRELIREFSEQAVAEKLAQIYRMAVGVDTKERNKFGAGATPMHIRDVGARVA